MIACCIFGHRTIRETEQLKNQLSAAIESLIVVKGVNTFLFGSKSRFNDLCYELVSQAKEKHPHIRRIYIRAEFPIIDDSYKAYLLERYEDTVFPEKLKNAGRSIYVQRNYKMIDESQYCLVYYDKSYTPSNRKSGTELALNHAAKRNITIFYFPNDDQ